MNEEKAEDTVEKEDKEEKEETEEKEEKEVFTDQNVVVRNRRSPLRDSENIEIPEWTGIIKVKSLNGEVVDVETNSSMTIAELIRKIAITQRVLPGHIVQLVHNGTTLERHKTLKEYNFTSGSDVGELFSVFSERIGEFGIGNLPGADLLEVLESSEPPSEEIVNKLCSEVRVLHGLGPVVPSFASECYRLIPGAVNEDGRKSLISHLESRYQGEMDLKYELTPSELISIIGEPAFDKLKEIYGNSPNEIWLRRVQSNGPHQGINWHIDQSYYTMQVALNGDSEFQGGKLVFAPMERFLYQREMQELLQYMDAKLSML